MQAHVRTHTHTHTDTQTCLCVVHTCPRACKRARMHTHACSHTVLACTQVFVFLVAVGGVVYMLIKRKKLGVDSRAVQYRVDRPDRADQV